MSCKCNNGTASTFGASFRSRNRKNYGCCGESINDTCGREMASSCQTFDGVPTRVYNSCGCASCIFPSFTTENGCSGNSSCGSCGCNGNTSCNSCGCGGNSSCGSCGCSGNTSCNSCGCSGNSCNGGCASSGSCGNCGGSSYGIYLPIDPVGLPFWYGGYYNGGCNCCKNSVACDSVSNIENKNVSTVHSPKRTAINK